MNIKVPVYSAACAALIACNAIHADVATNKSLFSINTSLGYLGGSAHEFVYDSDTGTKISQLNWEMKGAPIVQAEGNYQLLSWLDANLRGWITLGKGNVLMDDYDWLTPGQSHWSDWSHHTDTDLRGANEVDVSLRAFALQNDAYKLGGIIGYQRNLYSFLAKGGCYNYDNGTDIGCSPDGQVEIGYQQTFNMPYLGVIGTYAHDAMELSGIVKYSALVSGRDVDQHYQRKLTFTEGSNQFEFYNASLNAGYYVKPQVKLFVMGSYTYFPNKKTGIEITDHTEDVIVFLPTGSAGFYNKNYILALGVQYNGMAS